MFGNEEKKSNPTERNILYVAQRREIADTRQVILMSDWFIFEIDVLLEVILAYLHLLLLTDSANVLFSVHHSYMCPW